MMISGTTKMRILNKEIEEKRSTRRILQHETSLTYENLKQRFSMLDFVHTTNFVESNNNRKISRIKEKQDRKLFRLGLKYKYESLDPNSAIFNFSNKVLTPFQKEVLSNGLKFCFNPGEIKYVTIFLHLRNYINNYLLTNSEKLFLMLKIIFGPT